MAYLKKTVVILTFILSVAYYGGHAQVNTDRPDQSESSISLDRGDLQIEAGAQVTFTENAHSVRQWLLPTALFRYGITDGFELRVLSQYESYSRYGQTILGISDIEFGSKIQLIRGNKFNMLLLTHVVAPTGSAEMTSGEWGIRNRFCLSNDFSRNQTISYNLGYDYLGSGNGNLVYTLTYGKGVNSKVSIYAELFGQLSDMSDFELYTDAGLLVAFSDRSQFDFSFAFGITDRMNYISAGYSWLMKRGDSNPKQ